MLLLRDISYNRTVLQSKTSFCISYSLLQTPLAKSENWILLDFMVRIHLGHKDSSGEEGKPPMRRNGSCKDISSSPISYYHFKNLKSSFLIYFAIYI